MLVLFKVVINGIVITREPLCHDDLKHFLGQQQDEDGRQIMISLLFVIGDLDKR